MRHLTVQAADPLRRGKKLAGPFRDLTVLTIVAALGPVCRNEIASEYEWLTGEWLGATSLYSNLRRLAGDGLIRRTPRRLVGVLRSDLEVPTRRDVKYWEVTPRGDRTLDAMGRIASALSRASSRRKAG